MASAFFQIEHASLQPDGVTRRRHVLLASSCLMVICSALVALFWATSSPLGDLSHGYTDHLRHMGESRVLVEKGFQLYRQTYAEACNGVQLPCPQHEGLWPNISSPYPPLGILAHWPLTALELAGAISPATAHRAMVLTWLIVAFVACYLCWRLVRERPIASRIGALVLGMPLLIGAGANGFVDVAFLTFGLSGMLAVRRRAWGVAVVFFAASGAFHFRAAVFLPLGAVAVFHSVRARSWPSLGAAALLIGPAIAAAAIVAPLAAEAGVANPVYFSHLKYSLPLFMVSGAAALVLAKWGSPLSAATLLVATCMMTVDRAHCWWHAAILLIPPLAISLESARRSLVHVVGWSWTVFVAVLAYRHPLTPFWQWIDFAVRGVH